MLYSLHTFIVPLACESRRNLFKCVAFRGLPLYTFFSFQYGIEQLTEAQIVQLVVAICRAVNVRMHTF